MYPRPFLRSGHHTNGLINTKISFNKTYVDISLRCALSNFLQILERGDCTQFLRVTPELSIESWCCRCDWRTFPTGAQTFDVSKMS